MKVYVDDRQFDVQAEGTEEAARKVYGGSGREKLEAIVGRRRGSRKELDVLHK